MSNPLLPQFKSPPVIEVVLGAQFERLKGFTDAYLGAYWERSKAQWPHVRSTGPISPLRERFDDQAGWDRPVGLKFLKSPDSRVQMRNRNSDRMIQVQNGRFHYNWMRSTSGDYPHYSQLRPAFDEEFDRFAQFLETEGCGRIQPDQWEITYLNRIPEGSLWQTPADWGNVLRLLSLAPPLEGMTGAASFSGLWQFEIGSRLGRLHCEVKHGRTGEEKPVDALIVNLTARGPIGDDGAADLGSGLELGHQAIVRGFAALTTDQAHQHWERTT